MTRPAVALLSGGLDSAVTLAAALSRGFAPHALTVSYGQRHEVEIQSARRVAAALGVPHTIIHVPLDTWGGSALTQKDINVPRHDTPEAAAATGIPATYVPARNTIFLSLALAFAETLNAADIFIGVNAIDYSGYPDCRPEYIAAFENMAALATKQGVEGAKTKIHTPLIALTKAEIIKLGAQLGVDFSLTHSCYDPTPEGQSCGQCDSCQIRLKGFQKANLKDPLKYRKD